MRRVDGVGELLDLLRLEQQQQQQQQHQQQQQQQQPAQQQEQPPPLSLGVLLDQFGVLHDGRTPYPHAPAAVAALAAAGARVVVCSNSSRRSGGTLDKLASKGFDRRWFSGAVTSGELTHLQLAGRPDAWWRALGTPARCLHLTWSSRGAVPLSEALGVEVVDDPACADLILAHGTEAVGLAGRRDGAARNATLAEIEALLAAAVAAARARSAPPPPMVVANPDYVTVDGGALVTMPGTLARAYERLGGRAVLMGKPAPVIYAAARDVLLQQQQQQQQQQEQQEGQQQQQQPQQQPAEPVQAWLAIGDSLEHDIAGGALGPARAKTLLVLGGIHAADVGLRGAAPGEPNAGAAWDGAALEALCERHGGVRPDYVMAHLQP